MMFWILMVIVLFSATLLQAHLPAVVYVGGARWPLLCCVVLYYALNHRSTAGLLAGLIAGLLMDTLGQVPTGYSVLVYCVMALAASRYRRLVLTEAAVTAAFFGAVAGLIYSALLYAFLAAGSLQGWPLTVVFVRIVGGGLTGGVTAPVVFFVLARIHHGLDLEDKEEQSRVNA